MKVVIFLLCCLFCGGMLATAGAQPTRSKSAPSLAKPTTSKAGELKRSGSVGDISKGGPVNRIGGPGTNTRSAGPVRQQDQATTSSASSTSAPQKNSSGQGTGLIGKPLKTGSSKIADSPQTAAAARRIAQGAVNKANAPKTLYTKKSDKK